MKYSSPTMSTLAKTSRTKSIWVPWLGKLPATLMQSLAGRMLAPIQVLFRATKKRFMRTLKV